MYEKHPHISVSRMFNIVLDHFDYACIRDSLNEYLQAIICRIGIDPSRIEERLRDIIF